MTPTIYTTRRRPSADHHFATLAILLLWILLAFVAAVLLFGAVGCTHLSAESQATLAKVQDQNELAAEKAKSDAALAVSKAQADAAAKVASIKADADAKVAQTEADARESVAAAEAKPFRHPFIYLGQLLRAFERPLGIIAFISFLALGAGVGLHFYTPLSWLSKILVPVAGAIFGFSLFGLIAIPFTVPVIVTAAAALVALGVYELFRYLRKTPAPADSTSSPRAASSTKASTPAVSVTTSGLGGTITSVWHAIESEASAVMTGVNTAITEGEKKLGIGTTSTTSTSPVPGSKAAPIEATVITTAKT